MVVVLISVVPVTSKEPRFVSVSVVPFPNTAFPVTVKLYVAPSIAPLVVTVEAVSSEVAVKVIF